MASWFVCSSPDQAVWVRTRKRDIALRSWARHFTLTVSLSTHVYKLVPANLMLGVASHPGGSSSGLIGHMARMQTLSKVNFTHASTRTVWLTSLKLIERMRILHCSASDVKCLATQWNLKLTSIQAVSVNITFYLVRNVTVEYSTRTFFRRKLSFRFQRLNDLFDRYVARQIFKWTLWCVF